MRVGRLKNITIFMFVILFIQTNLNAEIIKFSNCKYVKDTFYEVSHEYIQKKLKE